MTHDIGCSIYFGTHTPNITTQACENSTDLACWQCRSSTEVYLGGWSLAALANYKSPDLIHIKSCFGFFFYTEFFEIPFWHYWLVEDTLIYDRMFSKSKKIVNCRIFERSLVCHSSHAICNTCPNVAVSSHPVLLTSPLPPCEFCL